MRRAAALALLFALAAASPAAAEDATQREVQTLAARAATGDRAALRSLRRIDTVGGRRVDLSAALAGAGPRALRARLETLAAGAATGRVAAADAREDAAAILGERRFHESELPRPFEGVLRRASRYVESAFDRLAGWLPGGRLTLWVILAALVVAAASLLTGRTVSRAAQAAAQHRPAGVPEPPDARRLEREADAAERRGDLELALRLRFRAGLLRLDRARVLGYDETLTSREIGRVLRSRDFDRLAAIFDEVVYGGRRPERADVQVSREAWAGVLAGVAAR